MDKGQTTPTIDADPALLAYLNREIDDVKPAQPKSEASLIMVLPQEVKVIKQAKEIKPVAVKKATKQSKQGSKSSVDMYIKHLGRDQQE